MAFVVAARAFEALLDDEVAAAWGAPSALAGLTVGGLVAHVTAATAFLGLLLDAPPPGDDVPVVQAARYYAGMEGGAGEAHDLLREMAESRAAKGPEANVAHFRATVADLAARLATEDPDRPLDVRPVLPFAVTVADFVATRVLELVVHGDDLATSVGRTFEPPAEAAGVAIGLLVDTARARAGDVAVLRALARAERAEAGTFPVL